MLKKRTLDYWADSIREDLTTGSNLHIIVNKMDDVKANILRKILEEYDESNT